MALSLPASPSASNGLPRWPVLRHPLAAYSAALALTILALGIRQYLDPFFGNASRLVFFMLAATVSAFLFGRGPGIASTFVGTALGVYFFVPPRHSFLIESMQLGLGVVGATVQCLIISLCAGSLHRALRLRASAEAESRALYESEFRAHEATAELNRTKDYFLAVLSHELRGPLSAIQYCVTDRLSDPDLPEQYRNDFALIERSARMQSRLITDLLDLTRLTRGKMEIERRALDLHLLLEEAVRTCAAPGDLANGPVPTLRLHAGPSWVFGDRDRLLQVFWNILRNARKFTGSEGSIIVETSAPVTGRIVVRIRDTGIGLSTEALARVFQPFEQAAQNHADKKNGGLGLGLAIARGIMDLHDGTLIGESDGPGNGTAFVLELPAILHAASSPAEPSRRLDEPGSMSNAEQASASAA